MPAADDNSEDDEASPDLDAAREEELAALRLSRCSREPLSTFPPLRFLQAQSREQIEKLIHYGPPYHEEYGGNLAEECADVKSSVMDIHGLLNEGADPHVGDPEDYNNTPLHYACRNSKLAIVKLLYRAGADINQVNELGVAALTMACMFVQPEPKRAAHRKLIAWLIEKGADVNHVDKGGHTAIEIASSSGNMPMVSLLLRHGATVKRDVEFLAIQTPSAVDVAADDNVRSLLATKLKHEIQLASAIAAAREAEELEIKTAAAKARREARHLRDIETRKQARRDKIAAKIASAYDTSRQRGERAREKAKREAEDAERIERYRLAEEEALSGVWKKEGPCCWAYKRVEGSVYDDRSNKSAAASVSTLDDAKALMEDTRGEEQRAMLQRRWRSITGLEVTKDHFIMGGNGMAGQQMTAAE